MLSKLFRKPQTLHFKSTEKTVIRESVKLNSRIYTV